MNVDEMAEILKAGFRSNIVEADEWRPLASHVLSLMKLAANPLPEVDDEAESRFEKMLASKRGQAFKKAIDQSWGVGNFYGPCAHGRDPYTRCDEGCGDLEPRAALVRTIALKQQEADSQAAGAVDPRAAEAIHKVEPVNELTE